jgi:hypothetical protein
VDTVFWKISPLNSPWGGYQPMPFGEKNMNRGTRKREKNRKEKGRKKKDIKKI